MYRLTPQELEIGMITAEPALTPLGQLLAPEGTEITRQLINQMKLYRVESVAVEGEAPADPDAPEPVKQEPVKAQRTHAQESKTHFQKVAASSEFRDFQVTYFRAIDQMKISFMGLIKLQKPIDTSGLLVSVSDLFLSRNTIAELFDMIYNMRAVKDAVYAHSLNVALISRMIGRWLKFETHDLDVLTLAGLLHDIGKLKIPEEILEKPDSLTDEEFAMIRQHPTLGYQVLKNQDLDSRIKKAALMHHERCDGSGYPSALTLDFIDNYAMIVAIADVYDAMTTARSYRAPLCPFEVISNFEKDGYQKYEPHYILTFLKQIATTYQSNRVMLSDGRGCNIVMLNQRALSRPIVQFDDNTCLDLSSADKELYIKALL
ncbi:MAG: HD domain-containing protein [Blautia sp.]|nr:HD domain-containing protein [Blautia sp.]